MLIIGLTGSIGMGKSTIAAVFRERGIVVFDADAEVHRLYEGAAAAPIEAAFPGATRDGKVNRAALSRALLGDPNGFKRLEAIVHPLVEAAERAFLREQFQLGAAIAVLEIPLLLETGGEALVDATIVVSAPAAVQRARVLARTGMAADKLDAMLARQASDEEKRRRADFVVDTGGTLEESAAQLDAILAQLETREGSAYRRFWA
jgi:dephospho-CoA kinase